MRLIDADALEDVLVNHGFCYCGENEYNDGVADGFLLARDDVKQAPTIDAEPVVRCCDCKYLQCNMRQDGILPFGVDEYECRHWCGSCDPTDFCSYGERREDVKVN